MENVNTKSVEWKQIDYCDGRYLISNLGEVKESHLNGRKKTYLTTLGYEYVCILEKGKWRNRYVHQLVALAFCEGYKEGLEVDHLDGDKTNNRSDNLEWVTHQENVQRSWDRGDREYQRSIAYTMGKSRSKSVLQIDSNGKVVNKYKSGYEAAKVSGVFQNSISLCCNGKRRSAGGYQWRFGS